MVTGDTVVLSVPWKQRRKYVTLHMLTSALQHTKMIVELYQNRGAILYSRNNVLQYTTMCVSQSTRQRQTRGRRQSAARSTRMIVSISGRVRVPPRCGQSFLAPASPTPTTPATTSKSLRIHKCPIRIATKCLHRSV